MSSAQVACVSPAPDPHAGFLALKPAIEQHARFRFRNLNAVDREEAIAEAVASGFQSYVRLVQRGKNPAEFPSTLATFAVLFVQNGRHVGGRLNAKDVFSPVAQRKKGFSVEPLQTLGSYEDPVWQEALTDNTRAPVPDQAAFRVDFPEFRRSLTARDRKVLDALAMGDSGKEIAERFGLSPARVTQLRKQWQREWELFVGEAESDESPEAQGPHDVS